MDQHSHSTTDKSKVNKEVNTLNNNIIDEMECNNNVIKDKVKGSLNVCIDVH